MKRASDPAQEWDFRRPKFRYTVRLPDRCDRTGTHVVHLLGLPIEGMMAGSANECRSRPTGIVDSVALRGVRAYLAYHLIFCHRTLDYSSTLAGRVPQSCLG